MRYYKFLRPDGSSLRIDGRVYYPLPREGEPGAWIDVPGNGAYLVPWRGDSFIAEVGPDSVMFEVEAEGRIVDRAYRIVTSPRVRLLRVVPREEVIAACPEWAYRYARQIDHGPRDDTRAAVSADLRWKYLYAHHVDGRAYASAGWRGIVHVGDFGTASVGTLGVASAGVFGVARAGDFGTAIVGEHGRVSAGRKGRLVIKYLKEGRPRLAFGHIGEKGLLPNRFYRLDKDRQFVEN